MTKGTRKHVKDIRYYGLDFSELFTECLLRVGFSIAVYTGCYGYVTLLLL